MAIAQDEPLDKPTLSAPVAVNSVAAGPGSTRSTVAEQRGPRLWPTWAILAVQAMAITLSVSPSINNGIRFGYMMLGPALCGLLFSAWLLFASRIRWRERFALAGLTVLACLSAGLTSDSSMGVSLLIYGVPLSMLAITIGSRLGRAWPSNSRIMLIAGLLALAWGVFPLLRQEGFTGDYWPEYAWRWRASREAQPRIAPAALPSAASEQAGHIPWEASTVEWPGFRGSRGDSRALGFDQPLDWTNAPPREIWRMPVGPGWSSFALVSGRLFTQEQRGEEELVRCYSADTGAIIWEHANTARFSEVVAGPGPRATPTYSNGRIHTFGAKGLLSCLDAQTGHLIWKRDLVQEIHAIIPVWGCSSSPVVAGGQVIVHAGGDGDHGLVAYEVETGEPTWSVSSSGMNFSSAQPMTLAGRELVLFIDSTGVLAIAPQTGEILWRFKPTGWSGMVICQPQRIDDSSVIVPLGDGIGIARLDVRCDGGHWQVSERWSTRQLRPSFNDFVYHDGHCYGFDQHILVCVDATTGKRQWKKGRYGFGQVILLPGAEQLIVTTESGEIVLVAADPREHRELGRMTVLHGKTWNHPIAASQRLFVRNGEEAVALSLAAP